MQLRLVANDVGWSNVTLDEMRRATEAMALHEALYARALALFFRRAETRRAADRCQAAVRVSSLCVEF